MKQAPTLHNESVEMLAALLHHTVVETRLRELASVLLPNADNHLSKADLVDRIVATQAWPEILDSLQINDFRVCSECGALMHEGYCCDMGYKYYCSDSCLSHDFTPEEWALECQEEPQSYWTDWFEHYELYEVAGSSF